jgi:hypothetical protein
MSKSILIPWPVIDWSISARAPELVGKRLRVSADVVDGADGGVLLTFTKPPLKLTPEKRGGLLPDDGGDAA